MREERRDEGLGEPAESASNAAWSICLDMHVSLVCALEGSWAALELRAKAVSCALRPRDQPNQPYTPRINIRDLLLWSCDWLLRAGRTKADEQGCRGFRQNTDATDSAQMLEDWGCCSAGTRSPDRSRRSLSKHAQTTCKQPRIFGWIEIMSFFMCSFKPGVTTSQCGAFTAKTHEDPRLIFQKYRWIFVLCSTSTASPAHVDRLPALPWTSLTTAHLCRRSS